MRAELEEINTLLSQREAPASFAVRMFARSFDCGFYFEFKGFRDVISDSAVRWLRARAGPARPHPDQTPFDPQACDAWEIPGSELLLRGELYEKVLEPRLEPIRAALGFPHGVHLRPQVQRFLILEPGQAFAPPHGTDDNSTGTLVITLPSRCVGGELAVEHPGGRQVFECSREQATLLAVSPGCRHEIQPVLAGSRLTLTFELIPVGEPVAGGPVANLERLTAALQRFFAAPIPAKPVQLPGYHMPGAREPERSPADRLVHLLDHSYTRSRFDWQHLKGADAVSAAALREAARRLDCDICLALADVDQRWAGEDRNQIYSPQFPRHGRRMPVDQDALRFERLARWEEPPEAGLEMWAPEGQSIELRRTAGAGKAPDGILTPDIDAEELCCTTPSSELRPVKGEVRDGPEGPIVHRWYHRAAVVLWPRERAFELKARHSPPWALGELAQRVEAATRAPAAEAGVKWEAAFALARRLTACWREVTKPVLYSLKRMQLLTGCLPLARQLGDPALAAQLLAPFCLEDLDADAMADFVQLLQAYGEPWCRTLLETWNTNWRAPYDARESLPPLCEALATVPDGHGRGFAHHLLANAWTQLLAALDDPTPYRIDDDKLATALLNLLDAAARIEAAALVEEVLVRLQADTRNAAVAARLMRRWDETAADAPVRRITLERLRDTHST